MSLSRHVPCRPLLFGVVGCVAGLLSGCGTTGEDRSTETVVVVRVCVLALCEDASRLDRIGSPKALDSEINEDVEEEVNTDQGEDGQLAVDPTGL